MAWTTAGQWSIALTVLVLDDYGRGMPEAHAATAHAMPALLREAREAYTRAIQRAFVEGGLDDMPRAGARVLGQLGSGVEAIGDLARAARISKQAASQLVDALQLRGYVERVPDAADRRRTAVALTPRGVEAATAIGGAVDAVDGRLSEAIGAEDAWRLRCALAVLAALGHGEAPPAMPARERPTLGHGKLCYLAIPADDVAVAAAFYRDVLGWRSRTRGDGSVAFDDGVGEVSGTWVAGAPPADDPRLLVYVMVDDMATTLARVERHGGRVVQGVGADLPEITARMADPTGNVLGLFQQ
jgi:predicted enzyme related to lactoylglutathione lyase/DNA-binding MarR family transcriptional regulator